jgi:two-component system response regulator YesN
LSVCRSDKVLEEAFTYYPKLRRLADFCNENYFEEICLQQAADIANLERTYFSSYFRKKVGVCFNCWLAILRIEYAKEHLRDGDQTISTIANKVGFETLGTFDRTFKRCTNMTASQYKKQVRPC